MLTLVREMLTLVRDALTPFRDPLPLIGHRLASVQRALSGLDGLVMLIGRLARLLAPGCALGEPRLTGHGRSRRHLDRSRRHQTPSNEVGCVKPNPRPPATQSVCPQAR